MSATPIEWTDFSINPFRARNKETGKCGHFCVKISPGCKNCYSSRTQPRFGTFPFLAENREKVELFLDESKLRDVVARKKPTKFFWCDMTDMFLEDYPDEWIDRCFAAMALTPQHTHQILTKRPERMLQYLCRIDNEPMTRLAIDLAERAGEIEGGLSRVKTSEEADKAAKEFAMRLDPGNGGWPLRNVWLGVSCEDQKTADERIPLLLQTPAAVRFVSYEPALGPVTFDKWSSEGGGEWRHCIDWLIIGGESGPGARAFNLEWVRKAIMQFSGTGNAVFVKQLGAHPMVPSTAKRPGESMKEWYDRERVNFLKWPEGTHFGNRTGITEWNGYEALLKDRKGGSMGEWPSDMRVREFPEVRS